MSTTAQQAVYDDTPDTDQVTPRAQFVPSEILDVVCNELKIEPDQLIGAPRVESTLKLAVATTALIARKKFGVPLLRGPSGVVPRDLVELLCIPSHKIRGAVESFNEGHLDTVAAHHGFSTAMAFYSACAGKVHALYSKGAA